MPKFKQRSLAFNYGILAWKTAHALTEKGYSVMWVTRLPKRLITDASLRVIDNLLEDLGEVEADPEPALEESFWLRHADVVTKKFLPKD